MSDLACPACLASTFRPAGEKDGYAWQECLSCRTTIVPPATLPGQELYDDLYAHSFGEVDPAARTGLQEAIAAFQPYRETGAWMDLGYGQGALLDVVEKAGWKPHGVETAPSALRQARARGWTVSAPDEIASTFGEGSFDVVSVVEVIEHVPQGRMLLDSARRLLRPGGALYLTTPNGRSLNRRVLGTRWSVFCAPDHVAIWTARGVRSALAAAGFELRSLRTTGFNPVELRQPRATAEEGVTARNTAGFELNRQITARPWARAAKKVVNAGLSTFGVGDTLKIHAVKATG